MGHASRLVWDGCTELVDLRASAGSSFDFEGGHYYDDYY